MIRFAPRYVVFCLLLIPCWQTVTSETTPTLQGIKLPPRNYKVLQPKFSAPNPKFSAPKPLNLKIVGHSPAPDNSAEGTPIAFVVWHSDREVVKSGVFHVNKGQTKAVPHQPDFASGRKMDEMITLLFQSARFQHPGCRLVILTDAKTRFRVELPGSPVEIVRFAGVDPKEEMVSRMHARAVFLTKEVERRAEGPAEHMVLLDTDMLITGTLMDAFTRDFEAEAFDIAATWRHDKEMPINGGILLVHRTRYRRAVDFLHAMIRLTLAAQDPTHRWFGTSDQVALAEVMKREHGYNSTWPGTDEAKRTMSPVHRLYTSFYERKITDPGRASEELAGGQAGGGGGAAAGARPVLRVLLLPCGEYNGTPEKIPRAAQFGGRKSRPCDAIQCCCGVTSRVLHFKGELKSQMHSYWDTACSDPDLYKCPVQNCTSDAVQATGARDVASRLREYGMESHVAESLRAGRASRALSRTPTRARPPRAQVRRDPQRSASKQRQGKHGFRV